MNKLIIKSTAEKKIFIESTTIELESVFVRLNTQSYPQPNLVGFLPVVYQNEAMFNLSVKNQIKTNLDFTPMQGIGYVVAEVTEQNQIDIYLAAKEYFEAKGYEVEIED